MYCFVVLLSFLVAVFCDRPVLLRNHPSARRRLSSSNSEGREEVLLQRRIEEQTDVAETAPRHLLDPKQELRGSSKPRTRPSDRKTLINSVRRHLNRRRESSVDPSRSARPHRQFVQGPVGDKKLLLPRHQARQQSSGQEVRNRPTLNRHEGGEPFEPPPEQPPYSAVNRAVAKRLRVRQRPTGESPTEGRPTDISDNAEREAESDSSSLEICPNPPSYTKCVSKEEANRQAMECCKRAEEIPEHCYSLCKVDANSATLITIGPKCPVASLKPYLKCMSQEKDLTGCCRTKAVAEKCMGLCYPAELPLPPLDVTSYQCFLLFSKVQDCYWAGYN